LENVPEVGGMDYLFCWSGLGGVRRWAVALVLGGYGLLSWTGWAGGREHNHSWVMQCELEGWLDA
jgi:hypothetical protein